MIKLFITSASICSIREEVSAISLLRFLACSSAASLCFNESLFFKVGLVELDFILLSPLGSDVVLKEEEEDKEEEEEEVPILWESVLGGACGAGASENKTESFLPFGGVFPPIGDTGGGGSGRSDSFSDSKLLPRYALAEVLLLVAATLSSSSNLSTAAGCLLTSLVVAASRVIIMTTKRCKDTNSFRSSTPSFMHF
jgi:hypothetical protein